MQTAGWGLLNHAGDLEDGLGSAMLISADDQKWFRLAKTLHDYEKIQKDLINLGDWVIWW